MTPNIPAVKYDPAMPLVTFRQYHPLRATVALALWVVACFASSIGLALSPVPDALGFWFYFILVVSLSSTLGWFYPRWTRRWTTYRVPLPWMRGMFAGGDDGLVWAVALNQLQDGRMTWREECVGESLFLKCPVCAEFIEFTAAEFRRVDQGWPDYGGLGRIHSHPKEG